MDYKETIDYLCDKLGVTYEILMPQAILYYRGKILGQTSISLICLFSCLFILKTIYKHTVKNPNLIDDNIFITIACLGSAVSALISICVLFSCICSAFCYFGSPTIYVIEQLLGG